ncbi:MAG: hypothetical protein ACP5EP_05415 [Acidobacteriaceae bacterium]
MQENNSQIIFPSNSSHFALKHVAVAGDLFSQQFIACILGLFMLLFLLPRPAFRLGRDELEYFLAIISNYNEKIS